MATKDRFSNMSATDRIGSLSSTTRDALSVAACISDKWDARLVQTACLRLHLWDDLYQEATNKALQSDIQECLKDGIIRPGQARAVVASYSPAGRQADDDIESMRQKFYEDVIQQAGQSAISEGILRGKREDQVLVFSSSDIHRYFYDRETFFDKTAVHFKIGKIAYALYEEQPRDQSLLVKALCHFRRSISHCKADGRGRITYMELFLRAAGITQEAPKINYAAVAEWVEHGMEMVVESDWVSQRALLTELYSTASTANFKSGRYQKCISALATLKNKSLARNELPHHLSLMFIESLLTQGEFEYAKHCCIRILRSLDEFFPGKVTNAMAKANVGKTLSLMMESYRVFRSHSASSGGRILCILRTYQVLANIALQASELNLFQWVNARMMQLICRYGKCEGISVALAGFGIACLLCKKIDAARRLGELAVKWGEAYPLSKSSLVAKWWVNAYLSHIMQDVPDPDPLSRVISKKAAVSGEYDVFAQVEAWRAVHVLLLGTCSLNEHQKEVESSIKLLRQLELNQEIWSPILITHQVLRVLCDESLGEHQIYHWLDKWGDDEQGHSANSLNRLHQTLVVCFLAYMERNTNAAEKALSILSLTTEQVSVAQAGSLYPVALALIGALSAMLLHTEHRHARYERLLKNATRKMKRLTLERKECDGFYMFLKGLTTKPISSSSSSAGRRRQYLQEAADCFEAHGMWAWQGLALEEAAASARQNTPSSDSSVLEEEANYLRKAMKVYTEWGARKKCAMLRQRIFHRRHEETTVSFTAEDAAGGIADQEDVSAGDQGVDA